MIRRVVLSCALVASCSSTPSSGLTITDGWARPTPPITNVGAFYFVVDNATTEDASLVGAVSDRCAAIEIHESVLDDDVMAMGALDDVAIDAGERVGFEPNGLHLMCLGLSQPIELGDHIEVRVEFVDGSRAVSEVVFSVTGRDG